MIIALFNIAYYPEDAQMRITWCKVIIVTTTSSTDTIINQQWWAPVISQQALLGISVIGLLETIKIVVSYQKKRSILHLLQIKFLEKYLMNNAENSISEPPTLPELLSTGKTCLVCHESLSGCGPVWQWFWWGGGGGGVVTVPYWIWKIVRPSEKILVTPLHGANLGISTILSLTFGHPSPVFVDSPVCRNDFDLALSRIIRRSALPRGILISLVNSL